jgi:hypothetical protein
MRVQDFQDRHVPTSFEVFWRNAVQYLESRSGRETQRRESVSRQQEKHAMGVTGSSLARSACSQRTSR